MRILSLQPSVSLILRDLGCLDQLVACTRYCKDVLPELAGLPLVADSWSTKAEELLPIEADIIIASVPYRRESLEAILKSGRPVLALAPHSLADVYHDIELIAAVAGDPARGCQVVSRMQAEIVEVRARASAATSRPLVYCEEWGKPLIHSQQWVAELVEAAGGRFLGIPGSTTAGEKIAQADPDILAFAWCGAGNRVPLEKTVEKRAWSGLRAVQSGRVVCIPDEWLNTPAPSLIQGLRALAAVIHPQVFPEHQALPGLRYAQSTSAPSKIRA